MKPLNKPASPGAEPNARTWIIRAELPRDQAAIESLVNLAFGPGRFAKTAYRLREGVLPDSRLSFVAQDAESESLWGSVRFWPMVAGATPALLLGPLAVVPATSGPRNWHFPDAAGHSSRFCTGIFARLFSWVTSPITPKSDFSRLSPGQVRFPGPVDPNRVLGLGLQGFSLASLSGDIRRARIDLAVSANVVGVGRAYLNSNG